MTEPSSFSNVMFGSLVLCVAGLFVAAMRSVSPGVPADRRRHVLTTVGVLTGWIGIPGALAAAGLIDRYSPLPAPALVLVGAVTIGTAALALSSVGARLVRGVSLSALVGFQAFRIPVELILHRLYTEGVIPVQMTYAGRNFDIVSGLTAVAVAVWWKSGRQSRALLVGWNLLGLASLANIVAVAVLSTPVPFRFFMNEPANRLPSMFPYVWLPTFLVQAALFGHLLVFRAIGARATVARRAN